MILIVDKNLSSPQAFLNLQQLIIIFNPNNKLEKKFNNCIEEEAVIKVNI